MNLGTVVLRGFFPVLVAGLLLLGGCAGVGQQARPRVSLANIRVSEVRGLETVFLVELRILNPNEISLQIQGIECELKVDDHPFATGLAGGRYEVAPYGSLTVPVPVYASMLDMVTSVVARLQQPPTRPGTIDPLRYEVTGHVRLAGDLGVSRTLPFASKGELSLPGPQPSR